MGQGCQPGGVQRCNQDACRNPHRFTNVVIFQFILVLVFAEFFSEDDDGYESINEILEGIENGDIKQKREPEKSTI